MSNWIKPANLPQNFWQECFIAYKASGRIEAHEVQKHTTWVRRQHHYSEWFMESTKDWVRFHKDLDFRVMPVEYPTITEEDFK